MTQMFNADLLKLVMVSRTFPSTTCTAHAWSAAASFSLGDSSCPLASRTRPGEMMSWTSRARLLHDEESPGVPCCICSKNATRERTVDLSVSDIFENEGKKKLTLGFGFLCQLALPTTNIWPRHRLCGSLYRLICHLGLSYHYRVSCGLDVLHHS